MKMVAREEQLRQLGYKSLAEVALCFGLNHNFSALMTKLIGVPPALYEAGRFFWRKEDLVDVIRKTSGKNELVAKKQTKNRGIL